MTAAALSPEGFARIAAVSSETLVRLRRYLALLAEWRRAVNLVGAAGLDDPWRRHMLDSAQLVRFVPASARRIIDLGSGAGFPGLVLALVCGRGISVDLIESNQRKAAFLNAVIRETGAPARVHYARIEAGPVPPAPVVTARACAPLPQLLGYAQPLLAPRGRAVFLKGRKVNDELTAAQRDWHMEFVRHPSLSDPGGAILTIGSLGRVSEE